MSLEDWTHQFCLACDKQTDGATYCSQSCRLADYENTSTASSELNLPTLKSPVFDWTFSNPKSTSCVSDLSQAYDFSNSHPSGAAPSRSMSSQLARQKLAPSNRLLSPSNSHTSLCSMKSNSSTDSNQLSERATRELQAYARSFDSLRIQRRRSY